MTRDDQDAYITAGDTAHAAETPRPSPADILAVAQAYASRDTWGVEGVYLATLARLIAQLESGIPAARIIAHASHTGRDCCALARIAPMP